MRYSKERIHIDKIAVLIVGCSVVALAIIIRLFYLQVLAHSYYTTIAAREQEGVIELPAQRGEIIIQDHHSQDDFLLATNITLNTIYADPIIIEDPVYVGQKLAPILFDLEAEQAKDKERVADNFTKLTDELTDEERKEMTTLRTDSQLEEDYQINLIDSLSQKQRQSILLTTEATPDAINYLKSTNFKGIEVIEGAVYAYPPQITDPAGLGEQIADYVQIPSKKLAKLLKGENRYVVLRKELDPERSYQLEDIISAEPKVFRGIGMQEEFYRFYPEGTLAANIIGYVDKANIGQYGIESTFNTALQGVSGKFQTKKDSIGRQITVGDSILEQAVDGDDIVLTIDRSVQLKVEKILAAAVEEYQADSGQVLIINPQTGAVIAMANYPSFDPNIYGEVFNRVEIFLTPEEIESLVEDKEENTYRFYTNPITLDYYLVFKEIDDNGNTHYYKYANRVGPEVYHNKVVSWPYEPGSVFKSIAMAIAIDDGSITPNTVYNDEGPVGVDWNVFTEEYDFEIKNAEGYYGLVNMSTVLAKSLNTGMTFIAKQIGPALFYRYIDKFGFLDRTDIEFDTEIPGKIKHFEDWTESELATAAFGQGITVTMIQLANAYGVIANGGILMQPYIIKEVRHDDGSITETEPREIRRVISEDTAAKMNAMLTFSTEEGVAKNGQVTGHYVGGKTGTSQTYKWGRALSGKGTTITSFAGFGPVEEPQFVILVKFDRPKASEWGSSTAAYVFSDIASYLFDYYNIPPDK